jgi:hypothetical protein
VTGVQTCALPIYNLAVDFYALVQETARLQPCQLRFDLYPGLAGRERCLDPGLITEAKTFARFVGDSVGDESKKGLKISLSP